MCTQNSLQVCWSYFVLCFLFLSPQMWICQACFGKQELLVHSICQASCSWQDCCASAGSSVPSRLHGSSICPIFCLSSAWVTYSGWISLTCLCAGCYQSLSWDHLWAGGHCQQIQAPSGGRTLGACTRVFGKSTKSGEREALGKEPAWKTRGKGYRRGWLYVSKWLFSAHVYPGYKHLVFVAVLYSQSKLMCVTVHIRVYIMYCPIMCTCALLGVHAQPGFCLGVGTWSFMGTWSFSSLPSVGCQIWWALTPLGPPCCPWRGQELGPSYGSGVHGCLVTPRPDRSNIGFVHFCLPEVPSTSGETSGFTCTEIRDN